MVSDERQVEQALRWRLVLGQHADDHLELEPSGEAGGGPSQDLADRLTEARALDVPLDYIYDREHSERMHRAASTDGGRGLSVPLWLNEVRRLFPKEAARVMEQDALVRYGLEELVTDPDVLRQAEPTEPLLHAILNFKHLMKGAVLDAAREIVDAVVEQLSARLETETRPAFHGPIDPLGRSPVRSFRNTDWRRTIRRNLRHYDSEKGRLVADRIYFRHRQRMRSPWHVVVAVDQSGSMVDSLIHSAVMAAIFARLPAVSVSLVLWDHRVMDVSHLAHDPVEVLMSCQLGGGTKMLPALQHCAALVTEPRRTVMVMLSDWHLAGERPAVLALAKRLTEAGVHGIGLSALDADCNPVFDEAFARRLAGCGWFVAALTPKRLAEHVGRIIA